MGDRPVPTLYEWMGGLPALTRLLDTFYGRVPADPVLAPVFAGMSPAHAARSDIAYSPLPDSS